LWAGVLKAVPDSQLLLKSKALFDEVTRERVWDQFREHGILKDRVPLRAQLPQIAEHLGHYSLVDIGLDPFPYHGTTTTCEALWMGVPVVSLAGDQHVSRVGVSLLTRLGLSELIAQTPESYIVRAAGLATHLTHLQMLRMNLRRIVAASPLCDATAVTRGLEEAFRTMWKKWCAERTAPRPASPRLHCPDSDDSPRA
jgi:predicted O-linked N-acetylglucosamine transferase (SPINDLY family)